MTIYRQNSYKLLTIHKNEFRKTKNISKNDQNGSKMTQNGSKMVVSIQIWIFAVSGNQHFYENFDMARADLKNHFQIGLLVSLGPPHIGTTTQGEAKIIFQKSIFMPGPY